MAIIVDGNGIFREIRDEVATAFAELAAQAGPRPRVAIVSFGASPEAALYTRQLQRAFGAAGVQVTVETAPADATLEAARRTLQMLSADPSMHGIQLQTPLPPHLPLAALAEALDPAKDLDGIHPYNAGLLAQGQPQVVPATPLAGIEILDRYGIGTSGAQAVVVGRSVAVGRPAALLLIQRDATVTVCHTKTRDLASVTRAAEILLVAAGQPGLIRPDMVRPGATVIDFGINAVDGKLVGDVDPGVEEVAGIFTPVPGGTGPVTNAMLLRNAVTLYQRALGVCR